jgi:cell division protein FtsW
MTRMVHGALQQKRDDPKLPKWWRTLDKVTLVCVFGLLSLGFLLGSAASPPLAAKNGLAPFHYVERQAIFAAVAAVIMLTLSTMSPTTVRRISILGFCFALISIALLPVLGTDYGKGAVRWYSLGFISLQPSEFLKPGFIVVIAWLMAKADGPTKFRGRLYSLLLTGVIAILLALQPDFGQASLIICAWGAVFLTSGGSILLICAIVGVVGVGAVISYNLSEHFARRIDAYLSGVVDPNTQISYVIEAIREGGIFGVGIGEGEVKWSLPDAHTDFIIAVAAEEFGAVAVLVVLGLYLTIVLRSFFRASKERDSFIRLAACGMAAVFGGQALINMGVATQVLPAKGMTLPLVSYGGSSLIAVGIGLGILLSLTRTRPQGEIGGLLFARGASRAPRSVPTPDTPS